MCPFSKVHINSDQMSQSHLNNVSLFKGAGEPKSHPKPAKRESNLNITQAVDNTGIWKNMIRKLDAPFQSPRRKARFQSTPLKPSVVEEEVEPISPRSPRSPDSEGSGVKPASSSNSSGIPIPKFQVTSL